MPIDQRLIGDLRIDARRRRRAGLTPLPQLEQERPQEDAVVGGVGQVVAAAARRRVGGRAVLRAAESVDADVVGDGGVLLAQGVGVDQRAAAVPVFRGALRVHHLGHQLGVVVAAEDAVGPLGERIGHGAVGEREHVAGVEVVLVLAVVPRRLGEAVVEVA